MGRCEMNFCAGHGVHIFLSTCQQQKIRNSKNNATDTNNSLRRFVHMGCMGDRVFLGCFGTVVHQHNSITHDCIRGTRSSAQLW